MGGVEVADEGVRGAGEADAEGEREVEGGEGGDEEAEGEEGEGFEEGELGWGRGCVALEEEGEEDGEEDGCYGGLVDCGGEVLLEGLVVVRLGVGMRAYLFVDDVVEEV